MFKSYSLFKVLPTFLKFLPLRKDFQENATVYGCIFELLKANNSTVSGTLLTLLLILV
jgi:hypothetical protein